MNTKKTLGILAADDLIFNTPDNSPFTTLSFFVLHPVLISKMKFE